MKLVPLREPEGQFKTREVIKAVVENSPQKALTVSDMRMRSAIMDKLEAATGDELLLESAEHQALRDAASTFPWSVYHKNLLQVLEDIEQARTPQIKVVEAAE